MLFHLFLIGSFWFWFLLLGTIGFLYYAMDQENGVFASIVTFLFFLILAVGGNFNVFSWSYHHPVALFGIVILYLAGGLVWAFPKWWLYCQSLREELDEVKRQFLIKYNTTADAMVKDPELMKLWVDPWSNSGRKDFCRRIGNADTNDVIPHPGRFKAKIISWMTYWPISLSWTLCHDFVHKLWNAVYHAIADRLKQISERIFANSDFKAVVVPTPVPVAEPTPTVGGVALVAQDGTPYTGLAGDRPA